MEHLNWETREHQAISSYSGWLMVIISGLSRDILSLLVCRLCGFFFFFFFLVVSSIRCPLFSLLANCIYNNLGCIWVYAHRALRFTSDTESSCYMLFNSYFPFGWFCLLLSDSSFVFYAPSFFFFFSFVGFSCFFFASSFCSVAHQFDCDVTTLIKHFNSCDECVG